MQQGAIECLSSYQVTILNLKRKNRIYWVDGFNAYTEEICAIFCKIFTY